MSWASQHSTVRSVIQINGKDVEALPLLSFISPNYDLCTDVRGYEVSKTQQLQYHNYGLIR